MARIVSNPSAIAPQMPKRKWWQYLPFLNQGYADEMAKYQNQYNEYWWNKKNQYDSPASQVARYQEAGLSPALMYGQGTPGNAQSMHQAEANKQYGQAPSSVVDRFLNVKERIENIKAIKVNNRLQEEKVIDLHADNQAKDNIWSSMNLSEGEYDKLTPRQRSYLEEMNTKIHNAKSAKAKAQLNEQLSQWFVVQMIGKLIPGVGSMFRFR